MLLNIQLDEQHSKKLHYLQNHLDVKLEILIQQGIDLLIEKQKKPTALNILQETGFIGCMTGDGLLSENYKDEINLDYKL